MKSSSKSVKDKSKLPEAWHRHYTDQERRILVQLVLDRFNILEQNFKDQYTLECKQEAWAEVVQRFNADERCNHKRDTRQIKKLWDNIKTRAKRMVTDQRLQKTMRGELSAATSTTTTMSPGVSEDGPDLDALADDSIAEKVIYYMKMTAQPQGDQMSNITFDVEDEEAEEDEVQLYTQPEYESMVGSEGDVILCDDVPQPCPPAPKRFALEPQTFRDPPHPAFSGPATVSSEFMGTRNYLEQCRESSSNASNSLRFTTPNHNQHQVAQPSQSSVHQSAPVAPIATTSRVTMPTNFVRTTPSYDGGWVVDNSVNGGGGGGGGGGGESRSRPTVSAAVKNSSSKGGRQSIKKLRKEECELRIRKLRLEMKYARIEHEERLKVIRTQQDVLHSLKPNPSSIISSLFK